MANLSNASPDKNRVDAAPRATPPAASAEPPPIGDTQTAPARVAIRMLKFSPERIEVKAGAVVEWANEDLTPHTARSQGGEELKSGSIDPEASWRHTFTEPGTYPYFCTFHPEMKGIVVVR